MLQPRITYTKEWTTEQINVALITERKAFSFSWLHHESYKYYDFWSKVVDIVSACFITLISGLVIILTNVLDSKLIPSIGSGCIIFASIIVLIVQMGWNPSSISTEHFASATENKKLHASLMVDFNELITHDQIQSMIKNKLKLELHMRDNAPTIPKYIWKKYYKKFGAKAIKYDVLNDQGDIAIPSRDNSHIILQEPEIIVHIAGGEITGNKGVVEKGKEEQTGMNMENQVNDPASNKIALEFINRLKQGAEERKQEKSKLENQAEALYQRSIHHSNEDIDAVEEIKKIDSESEGKISPKRNFKRPTLLQQYEMERYLSQVDPI